MRAVHSDLGRAGCFRPAGVHLRRIRDGAVSSPVRQRPLSFEPLAMMPSGGCSWRRSSGCFFWIATQSLYGAITHVGPPQIPPQRPSRKHLYVHATGHSWPPFPFSWDSRQTLLADTTLLGLNSVASLGMGRRDSARGGNGTARHHHRLSAGLFRLGDHRRQSFNPSTTPHPEERHELLKGDGRERTRDRCE